jgi:hypothetical protein
VVIGAGIAAGTSTAGTITTGTTIEGQAVLGKNMKRGLLLILAALLCGCANMSKTEQRMVSGAAIGGVVAGPIGAGVGSGVGYVVQKSGVTK